MHTQFTVALFWVKPSQPAWYRRNTRLMPRATDFTQRLKCLSPDLHRRKEGWQRQRWEGEKPRHLREAQSLRAMTDHLASRTRLSWLMPLSLSSPRVICRLERRRGRSLRRLSSVIPDFQPSACFSVEINEVGNLSQTSGPFLYFLGLCVDSDPTSCLTWSPYPHCKLSLNGTVWAPFTFVS